MDVLRARVARRSTVGEFGDQRVAEDHAAGSCGSKKPPR
jgi:hypothetical protein